jgi:alanyl-tRNA synthetase
MDRLLFRYKLIHWIPDQVGDDKNYKMTITANEIRRKYLDFFKEKGHEVIPSASVVPENDPTTLFTGSGMQPMLPYLMGEKHPLGVKLADSQKCFRTQDIEEIGDNRHTTFFEMLGNWSLGNYFKEKQISWMFEFLTKELGLDPKRIYVTAFQGGEELGIPKDDESVEIWQKEFSKIGIEARAVDFSEKNGMGEGKIFYYDKSKNWWSRVGEPENMPIGEPGGPDSEIFWDFGADKMIHENSPFKNQKCHVNCDCGRFLEIGNNVFMEYVKTKKGFEALSQKNVDFGGGLERMLAAKNDIPDIFQTDIFKIAISKIEELSGKKYIDDKKSFRVILDHLRASTFLIGDGVFPSNKDRGYFVRRLVRRAIRFAQKLGIEKNFIADIGEVFIDFHKKEYKNLDESREKIKTELTNEEEKFRKTLKKGLNELKKIIGTRIKGFNPNDSTKFTNCKIRVKGKDVFNVYQTYGFPPELSQEVVSGWGIEFDNETMKECEDEIEKHQQLSRTASAGMFKGGLADNKEQTTQLHTTAHLMLTGLRKVLGEHVHQKGSNINGERIRFDFSHPEKMTDEEKKQVEDFVNEGIEKKIPVEMKEMSLEDAKKNEAEGAFENKYGDKVKVYNIEGYSKEMCGGPHVKNTGEIKGKFKIKKEQSSSAGVRRIKAVLG